jgi:hypothetical protein
MTGKTELDCLKSFPTTIQTWSSFDLATRVSKFHELLWPDRQGTPVQMVSASLLELSEANPAQKRQIPKR